MHGLYDGWWSTSDESSGSCCCSHPSNTGDGPITNTYLTSSKITKPVIVSYPKITYELVVNLLNYWGRHEMSCTFLGEGKMKGPAHLIRDFAKIYPKDLFHALTNGQDKEKHNDLVLLQRLSMSHPSIRVFFGEKHLSLFIWPSKWSPWTNNSIWFRCKMANYEQLNVAVTCGDHVMHPQIDPKSWICDWEKYHVPKENERWSLSGMATSLFSMLEYPQFFISSSQNNEAIKLLSLNRADFNSTVGKAFHHFNSVYGYGDWKDDRDYASRSACRKE